MDTFTVSDLIAAREKTNDLYLEFLRVPTLSMGVYQLTAGAQDPQEPHTEDEVYYVVHGKAQIRVAEENQDVQGGSIVFVAANVEHRFHSITEDLTVLVFFSPAEYSNAAPKQ